MRGGRRRRFLSEDGYGPVAFANVVRTFALGSDVDRWDEIEERIRGHASAAVRRLLAAFPPAG